MANKYNSTVVFEKDSNYIIRCMEVAFGPSAAGNPMLTFDYEIVSPETIESAGETYEVAGIKMRTWQVCQTMVDGVVDVEKTSKNLDALKKLYTAFGCPDVVINPENPDITPFKGKCVYALLVNDSQDQRKSPTKTQLDAGQKQGDILLHPITKQPLKFNKPKIGEIFGLAPTEANRPY